ncbi:MAG: YdcF family protein [Holophaga sp.]|nr:YdcF family protein [Holophaga sp.]
MSLFSLEKALGLLVMPVGLIWLLILGGAGYCLRRRQRGPAALLLGIALLYGCAGNRYLAAALIGNLERRVPPVEVAELQPFDAVLVLGAGSEEDAAGRPELGQAGDRVFLAARLWHAGKARMLVASGAARDGIKGFRDGGQETRALWQAVGIPDSATLAVPEPCWNTRDEIRAYVRLQAQYRWRRVGLVSSASHLPRAMAIAARAGLAVTPLGADRVGRRRRFELQGLVPQGIALETTQRACWEYLGRWLGR